jgi:hypothetical protein
MNLGLAFLKSNILFFVLIVYLEAFFIYWYLLLLAVTS